MVDRKIDEKQASDLEKIYNRQLEKRKEIMKITQFKVEDVFGDILSKDSYSPEQTTKLNDFLAKIL